MDPYDLSIRLKTLDGTWEEVGAEAIRYRGVWPENVAYSHNDWGDDTCSFDLRRDPGAIHPDLSAFTDCEITVCGRLAWSGRVKETPTREGADPVINVQGEGWQYHLDDDQYERAYVHARLSDWKDMRSSLVAPLGAAAYGAAGQLNTDGGITLMFPNGEALLSGASVGIYIDLGEGQLPQALVMDYDTSNNNNTAAGPYLEFSSTNDLASDGTLGGQFALTSLGATADNVALIPTGTDRYLILKLQAQANVTVSGDCWIRFRGLRTFTDAAYRSGGASILRADQILTDALNRATLLLDPDRTGIVAGVFAGIPEFATSQLVSPREAWNGGNAFENYESKIDVRRPIFRPRASAPIYEIGEWSGAEFEDQSANSGAEILNRVFVEGQTAAGERLVRERFASEIYRSVVGSDAFTGMTVGAALNGRVAPTGGTWATSGTATDFVGHAGFPLDGVTDMVVNSGTGTRFAVLGATNLTGCEVSAGKTFDSGAGSLNSTGIVARWVDANNYATLLYTSASVRLEVVVAGIATTLRTVARSSLGGGPYKRLVLTASPQQGKLAGDIYDGQTGALLCSLQATHPALEPGGALASGKPGLSVVGNSGGGGPSSKYFDEFQVQAVWGNATLVDRRGFIKSRTLPVSNRITQASAARLGDLYLDQHKTTPFAGGFKAVGVGGVRRILGGQAVHPGWLGRDTGQLVRANHVIDPDTGGVGRDERIKTVAYVHNDLAATVSLAEDRSGFDALLAQLAVVVGS